MEITFERRVIKVLIFILGMFRHYLPLAQADRKLSEQLEEELRNH